VTASVVLLTVAATIAQNVAEPKDPVTGNWGSDNLTYLGLKFDGKRPDGMVVAYAIEGKIQGDTVTGTYKFGEAGGAFTFKKQ
jgi:hypothetical protein